MQDGLAVFIEQLQADPLLSQIPAIAEGRIAVLENSTPLAASANPSPLSIGTVTLSDGSGVKGFLVEAGAVEGARDITSFGGWRAFIAAQVKSA